MGNAEPSLPPHVGEEKVAAVDCGLSPSLLIQSDLQSESEVGLEREREREITRQKIFNLKLPSRKKCHPENDFIRFEMQM